MKRKKDAVDRSGLDVNRSNVYSCRHHTKVVAAIEEALVAIGVGSLGLDSGKLKMELGFNRFSEL